MKLYQFLIGYAVIAATLIALTAYLLFKFYKLM